MSRNMNLISELISSFDPINPNFRPTEIYNVSWLIKLVLHQAATIKDRDFFLSFLPKSIWYSEGLLPTAFLARYQGDPLSESRTNADGVIGQIRIGQKAKADLELDPKAIQFTVVEAKIGAPLSSGTSNAKYFDQAARNVACMAEVVARAKITPTSLERLDFIVLAPQYSIEKGIFEKEMDSNSILAKVKRRAEAYEGQLDSWFINHFKPTLKSIRLKSLSWELALEWLSDNKPDLGSDLNGYYEKCLEYK